MRNKSALKSGTYVEIFSGLEFERILFLPLFDQQNIKINGKIL